MQLLSEKKPCLHVLLSITLYGMTVITLSMRRRRLFIFITSRVPLVLEKNVPIECDVGGVLPLAMEEDVLMECDVGGVSPLALEEDVLIECDVGRHNMAILVGLWLK